MIAPDTVPLPTSAHALFLDFDGTLAPLQDDPDAVALPSGGAKALLSLAGKLDGAIAAISGRDIRDLSARVPDGIWRAGGHGLEICAPGEPPQAVMPETPEALRNEIEAAIASMDGVRAELKGPVIAIHYRAAPACEAELALRLGTITDDVAGYSLQHGKMVFEAKPDTAHKGRALATMMETSPFAGRTPIMVGDDTTDEDAMGVANELGGWSIKIGPGETLATHRLSSPDEVWTWLNRAAR